MPSVKYSACLEFWLKLISGNKSIEYCFVKVNLDLVKSLPIYEAEIVHLLPPMREANQASVIIVAMVAWHAWFWAMKLELHWDDLVTFYLR